MLAALLLLASACSSSAPAPPAPAPAVVPPPPTPTAPVPSLGRQLWEGLGDTTDQCDGSDAPPSGGLRSFACHASTHLDYAALTAAWGGSPFLRGPHTAARLDLADRGDFGRYDPAFVRWAGETFLPGADDDALRERTQPLYDAHVQRLARTMEVVYRKLDSDHACTGSEHRAYRDQMRAPTDAGGAYADRWSGFLSPEFCERGADVSRGSIPDEYDGDVVKTAVGWWLRRGMDGTVDMWHRQLVRMLQAYDREWIASLPAPTARPRR